MTIMLAGGMSFAVPSMVPAAHAANANLFVSAENSQFNNYMSGPQVIEVVVIDSNINDTDESKGEPDVTVNGKNLRMAQGVDGNWYGYFADRTMASIADSTVGMAPSGNGLDFGTFCTSDSGEDTLGFSLSDTVGFALPVTHPAGGAGTGQNGTSIGGVITASCTEAGLLDATQANGTNNVVREFKNLNINSAVATGQIGFNARADTTGLWPLVQLYSLNPTGNVVVQYNKGGGAQTTTLTFDTVDQFINTSLDKAKYTRSSQVHVTVTDVWLNIDPTDEDSWTFGTNADDTLSTNYQVFDENGGVAGAGATGGIINIAGTLSSLMTEDNGVLILNADTQNSGTPVLTLQDTDDSSLACTDAQDAATCAVDDDDVNDVIDLTLFAGTQPITITEQGPNSGIFGTYDESDVSTIIVTDNALRGTSATIDYGDNPRTVLVGFDFATIDIQPTDAEWTSGEEIPIVLVDGDANKNSRADEDLDLNNADVALLPALQTGDPFTLRENTAGINATLFTAAIMPADTTQIGNDTLAVPTSLAVPVDVESFSDRAVLDLTSSTDVAVTGVLIDLETNAKELRNSIQDPTGTFDGYNLFNYDIRSFNHTGTVEISLAYCNGSELIDDSTGAIGCASDLVLISLDNSTNDNQVLVSLNSTGTAAQSLAINNLLFSDDLEDTQNIGLLFRFVTPAAGNFAQDNRPFVADFFTFGFLNDGDASNERFANQIVRLELEETGDNTATFAGTLEFIMVNQLNILDEVTYTALSPISDEATFIVFEDLTDEDSPRVNYLDLGADGVSTQVADQEAAPSHSGVVSFDNTSYKTADTVTITLQDLDLNVDSDLVDIYTVVTIPTTDDAFDTVGEAGLKTYAGNFVLGRLLDVTFDDLLWTTPAVDTCTVDGAVATSTSSLEDIVTDTGLGASTFSLVETGPETGVFVGDFQIPGFYCPSEGTMLVPNQYVSTTGLDIEVNYVDFRDASGEIIEVGDSAGVRANTGSVSLDRSVYPVPFGNPLTDMFGGNTASTPSGRSVFPVHQAGMDATAGLQTGEFLTNGDLIIHVRVNDVDFDISAAGEDTINQNTTATNVGPVKISVLRGSSTVVLGYAGGSDVLDGFIDIDDNQETQSRQFGPMVEIAPDAGIFEADIVIRYSDGPSSATCPSTGVANYADIGTSDRFDAAATATQCILQGDILQVEYTDPADASGDVNTVTDSATFDLRNGVLQSDKSVYIIGSDMILTLIEPDFDLDSDQAETYDLDLIEWDSDADTLSMGNLGGDSSDDGAAFDPEPSNFRETGDSTGIFQIVIEIPSELDNDKLERGEEIVLEYSDWGPSGSDYVGDEDEDVNLTIFTSNFGATVELDQKVYTWTDKVYITIVAPDHNFDSNLIDEIGNSDEDPIKVSTRGNKLNNYKLVETGTDTGIFTGEVILTGFEHNADGDTTTGDGGNDVDSNDISGNNGGPTDGRLPADDDDGITVSFEFSEDETIVGSALIRWNIGEVQWLEASYPASGTGVVRVIDPDMNLNPEAVDNFNADVWSDSDAGGIDLTVTETNEATGIFEGTVFFTTTDEGDSVTAEYSDNTLPNPYTTADELDITATSLIGTVVPPLERAPAANLRVVDAFGDSLSTVNVDQQVQITADLANGQDREQAFAYLVQIQDGNGVTVSLAWITGSLSAGQSFSPALSWIPTDAGTYTATAFVWESVDNPAALSPPVTTTIIVK
jgi:hypothetical protein